MNIPDTTLQAQFYDGRQPVGSPATLILSSKQAALIGGEIAQKYTLSQLRVSPAVAGADRFIALPNGGQLQCADHPFLNLLPQEVRSEGLIAWMEQRWGVAVASVVIISGMVIWGYFVGLPAAAEKIAPRIPVETEISLGKQALAWLDNNQWFRPTKLDQGLQNRIRQGFAELERGLPMERYYRLEFRDFVFGANAFALPDGTIVISDDMVKLTQSTEEVLAVLAHEIGHVELRHTIRHVLQDSAVAVVASTLTSDAATLGAVMAGLPAALAQAKYSREFEIEADEYAFALLKQRGYSPEAFATLMERLAKKNEGHERGVAFVSTHPITAERVKRAHAAAKQ